jgi:hypothetical protein
LADGAFEYRPTRSCWSPTDTRRSALAEAPAEVADGVVAGEDLGVREAELLTAPNTTHWDWTDGMGGTVNPLVVGSSPTRGASF